jgi:hypothetical protein
MTQRENKRTNPLNQNVGDYVYMLTEPTDKGRKLQSKYSGPYVVDKIKSPHLVTLRKKSTGKWFKNPVHLDRLKVAFVRAPNPTNFYIPKIVTNEDIHADSASDSETELSHRKCESNNTQGADPL